MKIERTIYACDRCGKEIDGSLFKSGQALFKKTITATEFKYERYACLNSHELAEKLALLPPEADGIIELEGVYGYRASSIRGIHLCKKCSKAFRSFMQMGEETEDDLR